MNATAFAWVMERSPMTGTGLIVHLVLAEAANPRNVLCVDQSLVAIRARTTRSTVNRAITDLIGRGLMEVVRKTLFQPNWYRLLMPDGYPVIARSGVPSPR